MQGRRRTALRATDLAHNATKAFGCGLGSEQKFAVAAQLAAGARIAHVGAQLLRVSLLSCVILLALLCPHPRNEDCRPVAASDAMRRQVLRHSKTASRPLWRHPLVSPCWPHSSE